MLQTGAVVEPVTIADYDPALRCKRKDYFLMIGFRLAASFGILESSRKNISRDLCWIPRGRRKSFPRQPVSSGRPLSKQGFVVVQELKAAKDDPLKLNEVLATWVARMVKKDMVEVLKELERQDESDLALQIFETIRKEEWYQPDVKLTRQVFKCLWRMNEVEKMVYVYELGKREGLEPDYYMHRELIVAHLKHGSHLKALEMYDEAKALDFVLSENTYRLMIEKLQDLRETELVAFIEKEFALAFPERKKNPPDESFHGFYGFESASNS